MIDTAWQPQDPSLVAFDAGVALFIVCFAESEVGRQEAVALMLVVASSLPAHTASIFSMFSCGQWHASRA
jgi:hypothetical protein